MADSETFQHYSVLKKPDGSLFELGRGAMGVTYKAFDKNLRCHVALKVINTTYLDSDMAKQRFLREARSAAGLSHPNVASVFHLGEEGGNYFYAMEFINGETLEAFVRRKGPLPALLALKITLQVARALRAASREGLVHRDIKPANLMLVHEADDGEEVRDDELHVKVIDFGLAKAARKEGSADASASITVAGFVGTPHFASPEQLEEKDLDVRSDIYSLGITLWYMLTGKPPFSGSLASIMGQHIERKPPFDKLSDQPLEVVGLLEHLLEKDPVKRPQTASELRREIEQIIHTLNVRAATVVPATVTPPSVVAEPEISYPTEAVTSDDALASDQPLTMRTPETGVVIDARYRLLQQVAQGPRGTLFQAMELDSGRPVALKILPPELLPTAEAVAYLQHEVACAQSAPHPNLLQIFSFEGNGTHNFLTYEWINGFPLVEVLRNRHLLPPTEALRLLEPLASAADHARQNGLPDLDFSPSQVLLAFEATLDLPTRTALLGEPLVSWPFFRPKIFPLSLTAESGSSATWAGQQTIVPVAAKTPGALRQLALLAFELLGGAALPAAGTSLRLPPLPVLSEKGNSILRNALSENGSETFGNIGQFVQALRGSIDAAEPTGRSSVQPAPITQQPSASRTTPPLLPTHAPTHAPTHVPAPSVAPVMAAPAQTAARPVSRGPLMPVLLVLAVFLFMMAGLGAVSFFVWRAFSHKDSGQAGQGTRNPPRSGSPTPGLIAESTPPPQFTPAPTALPRIIPTPVPRLESTPAPRAERLKQALAEAQRLDNAGDAMGALDAYVSLAEDPQADQGLSRVDSFISEIRAKPLTPEMEQRRFPQMRLVMERAAALGSDQAMLYLADRLIAIDPAKAVGWYRKAADKGQADAMIALGNLASKGVGSLQPQESANWFQMASDKGSVRAKVYLAECYQMGHSGVERDDKKAFGLLNEALNLDANDERAMEKLALSYERGWGTTIDTRQAFDLMKRSADLGNPNAMGNLGTYYMRGLGAERNPKQAAALFKQGADKSNAFCMFFYAQCLEEGLGMKKDAAQAAVYFRAAAERGIDPARKWCQEHHVPFTPRN